jgi:hypothetical protein
MNEKGSSILEIIFVAGMFLLLLVPSAIFGQWWLFLVFMVFGIIFGLIEWIAKSKTGKTVSQHFWDFSKKHKVKAIIILVCMFIAWVFLLIHLGSKLFTK